MSVKYKYYNPSTRTDEATYVSSNVIYSKFIEDETTNTGELYVVFKGGKQYVYRDVTYQDYLMFKHGCVENSSGKSLNMFIVKNYYGEKIEDVNIDEIFNEMERKVAEEESIDGVWFVHGSEEYDDEIFQANYIPTLNYLIADDPRGIKFVFCNGDKYGEKSALYLLNNELVEQKQVVCYFAPDEEFLPEIYESVKNFKVVPSAKTISDVKDYVRSKSSDDICYISEKTLEKIRNISDGAFLMLKRRYS